MPNTIVKGCEYLSECLVSKNVCLRLMFHDRVSVKKIDNDEIESVFFNAIMYSIP